MSDATTNRAQEQTAEEQTMVRVTEADGVATVFLDNPAGRNGWSVVMEQQYFDLLDHLDADPDVRALVVTGAGSTFCPGLDIKRLQAASGGAGGLNRTGRRPMHYALGVGKPMIAAINGACAGLGLIQALCCDLRFAARGARMSTAYSRRGLPAEYGMSWLLTRVVRLDQALDLLLSGRTITAEEGYDLGLITRLAEPDELLPAAQAYAVDLAQSCSPRAMKAIRYQTYADLSRDMESSVEDAMELMAFYNGAGNPDFAEGVASFAERRPARFDGVPFDFSLDTARGRVVGHIPSRERSWPAR